MKGSGKAESGRRNFRFPPSHFPLPLSKFLLPNMATYRYPGAQPFSTTQEEIFFGREYDIESLYRLIRLEPLVVLYAKSGLGKSSLLNAGVVPEVLKDGKYLPVNIRFNAYNIQGEGVQLPLDSARLAIAAACPPASEQTYLERLLPREDSLWYQLKRAQAVGNNQQQLLLLFDQFEELFTYPAAAILAFKQQLGEVLHTQIPQRFRSLVEGEVENPSTLSQEELTLLHQPFAARIVFAIRADRVSLLDKLADYLPDVKRSWYELDALRQEQAEDAILNPAYKKGAFASPIFDYDDGAIEQMLDFLTQRRSQKIESFQLQILCQAIERKVIRQKLSLVTAADLGNIEEVYENYYDDQIQSITDPTDQLAARRFIEEGLIFEEEERRLSLYEGQIFRQYGISEELLRQLEDTHLIRREPSMKGGYTYELSHDTLVAPVLRAKELRLAEERKAQETTDRLRKEQALAEAQQKAEEERQLRQQAESNEKRARQRTRLALLISLIAGFMAITAGWYYFEAEEATETANKSAELAADKTKEAEANLTLAKEAEQETKEALADLQKQQAATEEQRIKAENNATLARRKTREAEGSLARAETEENNAREALANLQQSNVTVVQLILDNARKDIMGLDYDNALLKIKAADGLGALKDSVALAYLEIAFWHNEAGHQDRAMSILDSAAVLVNKASIRSALKKIPTDTTAAREALHETLKAFSPLAFETYWERYYPFMVEVDGGTFMMGDDGETQHEATVSDFFIAKYETTWWQYHLFCIATRHEYESPGWGRDGNNPAVNINWYDAVSYANWVSKKQGLQMVYTIDSNQKDPNNKSDYDDLKWLISINSNTNGYRLPTEAEWEYAAKGGPFKEQFVYSGSNALDSVGWYSRNSNSRTQGVGRLEANALGLYDMTGNVWEWCWDWYAAYPEDSLTDYAGPDAGSRRVLRGGSWGVVDDDARVSYRNVYVDPVSRYNYYGFRLSRAH